MKKIIFLLAVLFVFWSLVSPKEVSAKPTRYEITTPAQLMEAVNNLRISYGLSPLASHSILMQSAQSQADYMAATGNVTHARPGGVTYTQQLLSLGFPLAGDLSLGGFRAENILYSSGYLNWDGVPSGWQDSAHMNTMLSQNFTHIGAGISQNGNSYYYAVDTAATTGSGQMQDSASTILTSVPAGSSEAAGVSQFMVPITINVADENGNVFHQVQYGQSLWSIAIGYGTTIKNIQALNNLGDDLVIYQGQNLLVMQGATPAVVNTPIYLTPIVVTPIITTPTTLTQGGFLLPTVTTTSTSALIENQPSTSNQTGSRLLVMILIVAAFVGAGCWVAYDGSGGRS